MDLGGAVSIAALPSTRMWQGFYFLRRLNPDPMISAAAIAVIDDGSGTARTSQ